MRTMKEVSMNTHTISKEDMIFLARNVFVILSLKRHGTTIPTKEHIQADMASVDWVRGFAFATDLIMCAKGIPEYFEDEKARSTMLVLGDAYKHHGVAQLIIDNKDAILKGEK